MANSEVYILGGYQTDFARNWTKESKHFSALMRESVLGALEKCDIAPEEVESAHVGNFAAELYCMQGHLGAFFTEVHPEFSGLPTSRHEAACASGSIALLAASAEIEAGRYGLQAVVGIEQMKTVAAGRDRRAAIARRLPGTTRKPKASSFPFRSSSVDSVTSMTSAMGSRTNTWPRSADSITTTRN